MENLDILETDKKDDYSLGKTLKIDNITYSDLDELLVSHIESIITKMETLMTSPKYKENAADLSKSYFVILLAVKIEYSILSIVLTIFVSLLSPL